VQRLRRRELAELIYNRAITHIPYNPLRIWYLRALGAEIGPHVYLFGGSEVIDPYHLRIEANCHIGRHCQIDARGGIRIGRNVVVASSTMLITADHDVQDPTFPGRLGSIEIDDRVWLGSRVMVLKGVHLHQGAVAAAGSVIISDVAQWEIVGGVPARVLGYRSPNQHYEIDRGPRFY
jgi:putative colanic acid biosynthesis acetyltransferase WcaF